MNRYFLNFSFLLFLVSSCSISDTNLPENKATGLFTLIPAEDSGVGFVNEVEDTKSFNILTYRNFYNGGGVALGDINNDGLPDIYFTSNQHSNKLYLNKGQWKFEDITAQSGVEGTKPWTTGVAMADINADGLLDIYVCNSGVAGEGDRANELFINNGDLTFTEEAEKYGLNSNAFSVHASFFDYDGDGDLDCFLLNNSFQSPGQAKDFNKDRDILGEEGGDRLYRNDGEKFTDVSRQAGLHTGDMGFGLGVSVSDLNNDMLPDIYVSNDFWERDYLYINQGDGTFKDETELRIAHTSLNSMGADIADINNDGLPEIMTTDMLPPDNYRLKTMTQFQPFRMGTMQFDSVYHHQIMQNCLQLNNAGAYFSEVANLSEVAASDWSWGALMFDMNLDGWKDIFISNGIQKDITDFDFVDVITNRGVVDQIVSEKEFDFRDFLPFMPVNRIANCAFVNKKNLTFQNLSKESGLSEPSFSNGSAYADLDNDGDPDLVINNANMPCFLYRNNTTEDQENNFIKVNLIGSEHNLFGIGAKVIIKKGDQIQELQQFMSRGFESSVAPGLIFGVGKVAMIDTLKVIWPDKKMQILSPVKTNSIIDLNYADADKVWVKSKKTANPLFYPAGDDSFMLNAKHTENPFNDFMSEKLAYKLLSAEGPKILRGDLNGDALGDLILLGAAGDPTKLFFQKADGTFMQSKQSVLQNDRALEATCGALIDFDSDGDLDVLIGHGGNEIRKGKENFHMRLYDNDGSGKLTMNFHSTPNITGNLSCIEPCDLDNDGDMDLFIGARSVPGHYGLVPSSFLLLNNGDGLWRNITTEEFGKLGMVTAAKWTDFDNDNDQDLIVVGDWMPVTLFENTPGSLKKKGIIKNSYGWWSALEVKDVDHDGDDDYILGNWGLNSKFKAGPDRPLKLYVKDFDRNGTVETILEWYPPGEQSTFPFATKEDLVLQLPHLSRELENYADFGKRTYETLFTAEQRQGAGELRAEYLESAILFRDSAGFRLEALPKVAQEAPVFSIVTDDLDDDGISDLILFGNFYGLKPEVGRLDANKGQVFKGLPGGKFEQIPYPQSGLFIKGEVRDAALINTNQGRKLIVGRNNRSALVFDLNPE